MNPRNTWRLDPDDGYAAYNVLGAVRGPDASEHAALGELKCIVTARIRAIVFKTDGCAGSRDDSPLTPEEVKTVLLIVKRLNRRNQQGHFVIHLQEAVSASVKHPIWGGLGQELSEALEG